MNNELCSICNEPCRRFCSRCASFVCIDCVQFQAHQDADAKYQAEHAYDVPEYSILDMMEETAPAQPTLYTARDMTDMVRVVHENTYGAAAAYNHAITEEERNEAARRFDGWMGIYNRVDAMRRTADRFTGDALRDYERGCMEEIREMATSLYEVDAATHTVSWTLKDGEQVRVMVTAEGYHVMMQRPGEAKPWTPPSVCQFGPFPKGVNADTHIRFAAFLRAEITGAFLPVRHVHHAALEAMRSAL